MPEGRVKARTPWFVKRIFNPLFLRTNGVPILSVRGPRSERVLRTPINVFEMNGTQYLTSPRGETGWSRNLRSVGECSLRIKGVERRYRATEVPPAERPPLFAAYLQQGGGPTRGEFERLPDPVDHPTFRLEPI